MNILTTPSSMRKACLTFFALVSWIPCILAQNTPALIPFQGRLTDQAGAIVPDGSQTIIFNLYDVAVGGTAQWTERHENVGVIDGMVNVFLGSITTFPERMADGDNDPNNDPLFFAQTKYLGITIDDPTTSQDIEMIPRQLILPSFHARSADSLSGHDWSDLLVNGNNPAIGFIRGSKIQEGGIASSQIADGSVRAVDLDAGSVSGGPAGTIADGSITEADLSADLTNAIVPVGAILPYAGSASTVPNGWELCDGAERLRSSYPELFAVIGTTWGSTNSTNFLLPDMRGRIPAGKTDANTVDRLDATMDDGDGNPDNDPRVVDSQTLGAVGGEDMHQLSANETPRITKFQTRRQGDGLPSVEVEIPYDGTYSSISRTADNGGTGEDHWIKFKTNESTAPHNNIQPVAIVNYIIRVR